MALPESSLLHIATPTGSAEVAPNVDGGERTREEALDFRQVFMRYAPYVGSIALRILGRSDEVDDVVQDVFVRAHRDFDNLKDPTAIRAWLATITVRVARRRLRLYWFSRVLRLDDVPDYEVLADGAAGPETRSSLVSAYRALDQLSAQERIVWVLRQVEGESLETIAEACECSISTVQRRLRSAERKMKRMAQDG
jgi:RNA polymerase sigma-70 factor (ECF subfamily)